MNFLVVHQNYPGQFKHLGPALAARGHRVIAIPLSKKAPGESLGVEVVPYQADRSSSKHIHQWVADFETKIIRADNCLRHCQKLGEQGFRPDAIIAHPGWGETLFLKELWPDVPIGNYCEYYYHAVGSDNDFDPEFRNVNLGLRERCRIRLKNLNPDLYLAQMAKGICPTDWQASVFPPEVRQNISVIHDGIDTSQVCPNPNVRLSLSDGAAISRSDEVITFVSRNLEPHRGFHTFMRSLPRLLKERPKALVLIVGAEGKGYGAAPPDGQTWRQHLAAELKAIAPDMDWSRVMFLGRVPYDQFIAVLQVSTVHVYLTYPFVASWSLLEAMSAGAAIVASDTPPVMEFIQDTATGLLTDFFDHNALVEKLSLLLDDAALRNRLGVAARQTVLNRYDLYNICLPKQIDWCESLVS